MPHFLETASTRQVLLVWSWLRSVVLQYCASEATVNRLSSLGMSASEGPRMRRRRRPPPWDVSVPFEPLWTTCFGSPVSRSMLSKMQDPALSPLSHAAPMHHGAPITPKGPSDILAAVVSMRIITCVFQKTYATPVNNRYVHNVVAAVVRVRAVQDRTTPVVSRSYKLTSRTETARSRRESPAGAAGLAEFWHCV